MSTINCSVICVLNYYRQVDVISCRIYNHAFRKSCMIESPIKLTTLMHLLFYTLLVSQPSHLLLQKETQNLLFISLVFLFAAFSLISVNLASKQLFAWFQLWHVHWSNTVRKGSWLSWNLHENIGTFLFSWTKKRWNYCQTHKKLMFTYYLRIF